MSIASWTVTTTLKNLTSILCKIDGEALKKVPKQGPLILVCNHVNFLDTPLLYSHLQPRPLTGFAKSETWDNPFLAKLFTLFEAIPIRRGKPDKIAMQKGWEALKQGKIVAISPEGTRSGHGRLQRGHPGVVTFALHANVPILPMAYYGAEKFHSNIRRLRRTEFHIRVGKPFYLDTHGVKVTREIRQEITNEIMAQIAILLPDEFRGVYTGYENIPPHYLKFIEDQEN